MNTTNFEKFMQREMNGFLKELNRLNLLSTTLKVAKSHLSSGEAYECKVKSTKVGRPKKAKLREVSELDVIADLTARASPKKSSKPKMSEAEKAALKEQKAALKKQKADEKAALKKQKADEKAEKAALKEKEKVAKKALATQLREEKKKQKALLKEQKKAAKLTAKKERELLKKQKTKEELERKSKEAQALMKNMPKDVPIKDADGKVIGSAVEGFNVPVEKNQSDQELKSEEQLDGFTPLTHNSRPNDKLYIDGDDDVFLRKGNDLEHIGYIDKSTGMLIEQLSDNDEELSDTE